MRKTGFSGKFVTVSFGIAFDFATYLYGMCKAAPCVQIFVLKASDQTLGTNCTDIAVNILYMNLFYSCSLDSL